MALERKCDGCGVPVNDTLCCARCLQRIRQMRGEHVEIFAVTFTVIADNVETAKAIAQEVLGAHVRDGLDYTVRAVTETASPLDKLEPMNCDAHP